jgi:hypothetical protein
MDLLAFHAAIGLFAVIFFVIGVKLLADPDWFSGFIRGVIGMAMLSASVAGGYIIFDMLSFKTVQPSTAIAEISVSKTSRQRFEISIKGPSVNQSNIDVLGDQAEFKIQMLLWSGPAIDAGLKTAYRFESVQGRFLTLEQEKSIDQSPHLLKPMPFIQFWRFLNQYPLIPFVEAKYAEAIYVPLANGAIFELVLETDGIKIQPKNAAANKLM